MEHKPNDLERQIAVLEERMNTKQAEYKTDIAQLAAKNDLLRAYISDWKSETATKQMEYQTEITRLAAGISDWKAEAATKQTEYKTEIARLAADIYDGKIEAAKRETRLVMVLVALISVAVAILKFT